MGYQSIHPWWAMRGVVVLLLCALFLPSAMAATIKGSVYDESLSLVSDVKVGISSEPRQQLVSKDGLYQFEVSFGEYVLTAYQVRDGQVVASAQEEVSISQEGEFVFDVVLFPNLNDELSQLSDIEALAIEDPFVEAGRQGWVVPAVVTALIVIVSVVATLLVSRGFQKTMVIQAEEQANAPSDNGKKYAGTGVSPKEAVAQGADKASEPLKNEGSSASSQSNAPSNTPSLSDELNKVVEVLKAQGGRVTQKELRKAFPLSEGKVSLMITELEHKGVVEKIKKGRGNILILKGQ